MRLLAVVALVAALTTGCDVGPSDNGTCAHAGSSKATNLTDFYGTTHSMAETYVWVQWKAFTGCTQAPLMWTDWRWSCESWDYPWSGNTQTVAGSCWQAVYDSYNMAGTTAVDQAQFEGHDGFADRYTLRSRVYAAPDGWVYWSCGRSENLNGGGTFGWVSCQFDSEY